MPGLRFPWLRYENRERGHMDEREIAPEVREAIWADAFAEAEANPLSDEQLDRIVDLFRVR